MTTIPAGLYPVPVAPFSAKGDFKADAFFGVSPLLPRQRGKGHLIAADAGACGPCVKPPHYVHSWADALTPAIVRRFEVMAKGVPLPMLIGAGGGIGTIPAA
jgi:hypothetical protein